MKLSIGIYKIQSSNLWSIFCSRFGRPQLIASTLVLIDLVQFNHVSRSFYCTKDTVLLHYCRSVTVRKTTYYYTPAGVVTARKTSCCNTTAWVLLQFYHRSTVNDWTSYGTWSASLCLCSVPMVGSSFYYKLIIFFLSYILSSTPLEQFWRLQMKKG